MSNKDIQTVLQDLLEEEIPSSEVNLWPDVQARLVAGRHQQIRQGTHVNPVKSRRTLQLALTTLLLLAMTILLFATPQGRSFAQDILELFTPAERRTFPVEEFQTVPPEPDESLPTAVPPAALISVDEAEKQVGFNIAELPNEPAGFNYLGARLYGDNVSIEYQAEGGGGHLIILQSREGFYQSDWDSVPADAIVPVKIGELDGEFAQGTFVVYRNETVATWNPDAPLLRLRWVNDGVWFEMTKFGDPGPIEYLGLPELLKLAESLTNQPQG